MKTSNTSNNLNSSPSNPTTSEEEIITLDLVDKIIIKFIDQETRGGRTVLQKDIITNAELTINVDTIKKHRISLEKKSLIETAPEAHTKICKLTRNGEIAADAIKESLDSLKKEFESTDHKYTKGSERRGTEIRMTILDFLSQRNAKISKIKERVNVHLEKMNLVTIKNDAIAYHLKKLKDKNQVLYSNETGSYHITPDGRDYLKKEGINNEEKNLNEDNQTDKKEQTIIRTRKISADVDNAFAGKSIIFTISKKRKEPDFPECDNYEMSPTDTTQTTPSFGSLN